MNEDRIRRIELVRRFLEGTADVELLINTKQKRYELVKETLVRFPYLKRSKGEKGLLLKFLEKVSGYSYAGVKRFVRQYFETGQVAKSQGKEKRVYKEVCECGHIAAG